VKIDYKGAQEHPVDPLCIGNSKVSVRWCADQIDSNESDLYFAMIRKRVAAAELLDRIISDVPPAKSKLFLGAGAGKEIEVTVVEHGAVRRVLLKGDMSEALLRKFINDSGSDAELRTDLEEFHWRVDAYAR
jgi:hypothetical protein